MVNSKVSPTPPWAPEIPRQCFGSRWFTRSIPRMHTIMPRLPRIDHMPRKKQQNAAMFSEVKRIGTAKIFTKPFFLLNRKGIYIMIISCIYPIGSMYDIFTHLWLMLMGNVSQLLPYMVGFLGTTVETFICWRILRKTSGVECC